MPFRAYGLPDSLSFLRERLTNALITEMSRQPGVVMVASGTMLTLGDSTAPPPEIARQPGARFVV